MDNQMYHKIITDKFSTAYEICKLLESSDDVVFSVEINPIVKSGESFYEFIIFFAFEGCDCE